MGTQGLAAHPIRAQTKGTRHPVKVHSPPPQVRRDLARDLEPPGRNLRRDLLPQVQMLTHRRRRQVMSAPQPQQRLRWLSSSWGGWNPN